MAERSLAHVEEIKDLQPIPGYDRVVLATILGWRCIVGKDDFKIGDKCVYFEIDSMVNPEDERFAFMEKRKYKVKTLKMCKSVSQGLAMPLYAFPELGDLSVGTDVTEKLKVTYYDAEDAKRKGTPKQDPMARYKSMAARHKNLFKKKPFRWLMKREWGRKFLFLFFGKKRDNPKSFPSFVKKTDEERVENMPWVLEDENRTYSVTEKLDGTSTTFSLEQKKGYDFAVCSRNVRQLTPDQECYHDLNVYWEMAEKYNIQAKLEKFAKDNGVTQMYLQGETVGPKVQGNPLLLNERGFYAFNLWVDGKRYGNAELFKWCDDRCIPHVPLVVDGYKLPDNMEDMKKEAEGYSMASLGMVKREGLVYRAEDDEWFSFKNVSNAYLMKE